MKSPPPGGRGTSSGCVCVRASSCKCDEGPRPVGGGFFQLCVRASFCKCDEEPRPPGGAFLSLPAGAPVLFGPPVLAGPALALLGLLRLPHPAVSAGSAVRDQPPLLAGQLVRILGGV